MHLRRRCLTTASDPDRAFDARYDSQSPRHGTGPAVLLEALRCLGPERAQSNRRVHHHGSRVAQALNSAAWGRSRSQNDGLLTNLLTNRSVSRGTEAHISDRSPRSRPGIRRSGLSMAWKRSGFESPKLHQSRTIVLLSQKDA
jgi:hypothetical protein